MIKLQLSSFVVSIGITMEYEFLLQKHEKHKSKQTVYGKYLQIILQRLHYGLVSKQ